MTTATYTRSGNAVTVSSVAHGMTVGRFVYCKFTTGTAVTGAYQVLAAPTADTFVVASATSGTIASSAVIWGPCGNNAAQLAVTTAAATSQPNASTTITITPSGGHSFAVENIIFIKWAAGAAQTDGFFRVASVSTTVSFTVVGSTNGTGSTRNSTCDYANEGTYNRASTTGGTATVTTPVPHNLSSNQQIYATFGSTSATAQTDGYFTVTVTSATTFTIPVSTSSGAQYGQLFWSPNCATFSQSGTAITIYQPNHGFAIGREVALSFVGTSTPADVLYEITGIGTNDFDVVATTSLTATGGVLIGTAAMEAEFDFGTRGTVDAATTVLQQRGTFSLGVWGTVNGALTSLDQFSEFVLNGMTARVDAGSVTQTQTSLFPLLMSGRVEAGRELNHEASYTFTVDGVLAASAHPEDQDARLAPHTITGLGMTSAMIVSRGFETVMDILDDAARQCGYQFASQMPDDGRKRLVDDLNASVVKLFAQAHRLDYFNKATREYTLPDAQRAVSLQDDVQSLLGYVRASSNDKPLMVVKNRSEIDRFATLYRDADQVVSAPLAYYCAREGAATADAFTHQLIFDVAPSGPFLFKVEVAVRAPRYNWADYLNRVAVRVPQRYASAILMPIMRYLCMSNFNFANTESASALTEQYRQAMRLLGVVEPRSRQGSTTSNADEKATVEAGAAS